MNVAREEVDVPIDVVGYIHGGHLVEQSKVSNGVKGLAEVQRDDHYIPVAHILLSIRRNYNFYK